jgi:hypothetical protein
VNIREPKNSADIPIRHARVVQAEQMQQGGVQIVPVRFVLDRELAVIVGLAIRESRLPGPRRATSGGPCGS